MRQVPLFGFWLPVFVVSIGLSTLLACSAFGIRYVPVRVVHFPSFVKGQPRDLPPHRILVLRPVDKRQAFVTQDGPVAPHVRGAEIVAAQWSGRKPPPQLIQPETLYPVIGFLGTSSQGSVFLRPPSEFSPPDHPQLVFYAPALSETVQHALASHIDEVGLPVHLASFASPPNDIDDMLDTREREQPVQADYALGCTIEVFALRSLFYRVDTGMHGNVHPMIGPSWAHVRLGLTLYRWPSGEKLWAGTVGEQFSDPEPGGDIPLYGSLGEVVSVALSRAVGSFLITQAVQDILLHPTVMRQEL